VVQHSRYKGISGTKEYFFFGRVENLNAGETRNGQAENKILGGLNSDKQCGRFFLRGKEK
jgi:hypothetical protein